ncbi:hypothetical protein [Natronomonas sp. EA1]|uniref:DUF7861 family protein n=1 Tax=Natronomonas sp. EA1 TaxID=3421655 RepID=UPI003EB9E479
MHDRIRAKPPVTDVDSWNEGTVDEIRPQGEEVVVVCDGTDIRVRKAVYDLFVSRLPAVVDGESVVGQTVWYK